MNLLLSNAFSVKEFLLKFKEVNANSDQFLTFMSNLHKVTSFFDVTAVKPNVPRQRRYVTCYTTNAFNTRDFYPVLGEIRFVGTGEIPGYPYLVCKKVHL